MTILIRVCHTCAKILIYNDPSPENYVGKNITLQCPDCGALQSWKEEEISVQ